MCVESPRIVADADEGTVASTQSSITDRNARILEMRCAGMTLEAIGNREGLTRERVRQILSSIPRAPTAAEVRSAATAARDAERSRRAQLVAEDLTAHPGTTIEGIALRTSLTPIEVRQAIRPELRHLLTAPKKTKPSQTWSDAAIFDALRLAQTYEFPLSIGAYDDLVRCGEISGPSAIRILQRFRSWITVCDLAGVEPARTRRVNYDSRWTNDDIYRSVLEYLDAPGASGTFAGYDAWAKGVDGAPSGGTVRTRLGGWNEVKRDALQLRYAASIDMEGTP